MFNIFAKSLTDALALSRRLAISEGGNALTAALKDEGATRGPFLVTEFPLHPFVGTACAAENS